MNWLAIGFFAVTFLVMVVVALWVTGELRP